MFNFPIKSHSRVSSLWLVFSQGTSLQATKLPWGYWDILGPKNLLIGIPKSYWTAFHILVRGMNGSICQTSWICASSERTSLDAVPSDWEWLTALRRETKMGTDLIKHYTDLFLEPSIRWLAISRALSREILQSRQLSIIYSLTIFIQGHLRRQASGLRNA